MAGTFGMKSHAYLCNMTRQSTPSFGIESDARLYFRAFLRTVIFAGLCVYGGIRGYWPAYWFLVLTLVMIAVNLTVIKLRNPGLLRERLKPDRPQKGWDRVFLVAGGIAGIAIVVVAPLDFFYHLGPKVPDWLVFAGAIPFLGGDAFIAWVMGENPFLERTVRIQEDRNHVVITTGPYALVRHPMYTGFLICSLGWPLVLGSYWAAIPVFLLDVSLIVRTYFEDRTLHEELPGYREYALKTKYRLIPGVW